MTFPPRKLSRRSRAEHQTDTRRVVIAARQRKGRTLTAVVGSEAEGVAFIEAVAAKSASVHADEAPHWDVLHQSFPVSSINHSEAYCYDGACTNQAESYFSRLRRMVSGQHHHVSTRYLHQYAAQAAWPEEHRRTDNGAWSIWPLPCRSSTPSAASGKGIGSGTHKEPFMFIVRYQQITGLDSCR